MSDTTEKLAADAVVRGSTPTTELYKQLAQWRGIRSLGGHWAEHPDHDAEAWRDEVAADHTRESYDEWVVNQIEQAYYEANEEDVP